MPGGVRGGDSQWWWYHSRAGIISQRFGITCTSQSLLLQSISPLLLSLCMYITRITLCHVLFNPSSFSCSYSFLRLSSLGPRLRLLLPSSGLRLRLHLPSSGPRLPLLLSSPGSKCSSSLEPQLRLPKNPRSVSPFSTFCILPRIEYSSLQFHFDIQQNDISSNVIIMY